MGMITPNDPLREFKGYVDKDETDKKLVRDVFLKGDMGYSSGDILIMDHLGYFYFKDRGGDTFRWKGENVSTAEVEAVLSNITDFRDCCVYGVEIPGINSPFYSPTTVPDIFIKLYLLLLFSQLDIDYVRATSDEMERE